MTSCACAGSKVGQHLPINWHRHRSAASPDLLVQLLRRSKAWAWAPASCAGRQHAREHERVYTTDDVELRMRRLQGGAAPTNQLASPNHMRCSLLVLNKKSIDKLTTKSVRLMFFEILIF
jgi:hypothetical protein